MCLFRSTSLTRSQLISVLRPVVSIQLSVVNINGDSKNCKDWFKLARKASVNAKLQKEHPVLIPEDSVKRDSDESLFIREEEQKKIEEDLD